MKKLFMIVLVMCLGMLSQAQTSNDLFISGYVTLEGTGAAQADYPVYVSQDNGILQTVYTNDNGWYNVIIVNGSVTGPNQVYTVFTVDSCWTSNLSSNISNNQGTVDEAIVNFEICSGELPPSDCNPAFVYALNGDGTQISVDPSSQPVDGMNYHWTLNGTLVSEAFQPAAISLAPGVNEICLLVYNGNCENVNCVSLISGNDTLPPQGCQAYFNSSVSNVDPLRMIYTDDSYVESNNVTYSWSFGDGATSSTMNAEHTYDLAGTYVVCLTVSTENCTDTYCSEITVSNGSTSGDCNASFTWGLTGVSPNGVEGIVAFQSAYTGNEAQVEHTWVMPNGTVLFTANPSLAFVLPGTYSVCHFVQSNALNCIDSVCTEITLFADTTGSSCDAYFSATISQTNPFRVLCTNLSPAGNVAGADYVWTFDDGATSTSFNAEHTFDQSGSHQVCLTITTDLCTNTYCTEVFVPGSVSQQYIIGGYVYAGNNFADHGTVRLYSYDETSMAVELVQVVDIDTGTYFFSGVPAGTYLIKARLGENSEWSGQYLPTYFGSQFYWFDAEPIVVSENGFSYNISLIYASNQGGDGNVNGTIDDGPYRLSGNSASSASTLVDGADVFVSGVSDNSHSFDVSDASGSFSFTNLAFGTYRLMADVPGMLCTPVEFTLTATSPTADISLVMGDQITAIAELQDAAVSSAYPNPAYEIANFDVQLKSAMLISIQVISADGRLVESTKQAVNAGRQALQVSTGSLAQGVYFVQFVSANGQLISVKKMSVN